MHVAMSAVVGARGRLRSKGHDVLLVPKFVTVDTTSTLGWESVFLRFHIMRCSMAASASGGGPASRSGGPDSAADTISVLNTVMDNGTPSPMLSAGMLLPDSSKTATTAAATGAGVAATNSLMAGGATLPLGYLI